MKRHDSLSRSGSRPAARGTSWKSSILLVWGLSGGAAAIGCGPKTDPGTTDSGASTSGTTAPGTSTSGTSTSTSTSTGTSTTGDAPTTTVMSDPCDTGGCIDSSSGGCSFLGCIDMCPTAVHGLKVRCSTDEECEPFIQDCPEGEKCTAWSSNGGGTWDANKCVEVTGAAEPGDECSSEGAASGVDSCIKGAMCWSVDDMGVGTCVALCTGSPDAPVCADDDGACVIANDGALNLCLPVCDPLLQDCLDPNEVCYPINDGFACAPDASGEEGQHNDSCGFINSCDKGLMCADAAVVGAGCEPPATGCCTPFCECTMWDPVTFKCQDPAVKCPNPDQSCVQYFTAPFPLQPANAEDIGVCGVPQ
jgi:hypothetical protein